MLSMEVVGGGGTSGFVLCSLACSLNCAHKRSRPRSPTGMDRYACQAAHALLLSLGGCVVLWTLRVMASSYAPSLSLPPYRESRRRNSLVEDGNSVSSGRGTAMPRASETACWSSAARGLGAGS